jgi:hypothetical protein
MVISLLNTTESLIIASKLLAFTSGKAAPFSKTPTFVSPHVLFFLIIQIGLSLSIISCLSIHFTINCEHFFLHLVKYIQPFIVTNAGVCIINLKYQACQHIYYHHVFSW